MEGLELWRGEDERGTLGGWVVGFLVVDVPGDSYIRLISVD